MVTSRRRNILWAFISALVAVAALVLTLTALAAAQSDIIGPAGSGQFGKSVTVLPNGNIVVTDPNYNAPGPTAVIHAGAAYLYNGGTGALISALIGSQANDQVGSGGVVVLTNGNYVVLSPAWANGATASAGAATWGNAVTGITGVVSVTNSLVGGQAGDGVGGSAKALTNGNYVVLSYSWHNGAATQAGAATWGNGATGSAGVVTVTNSLVGSQTNDRVGGGGVTPLTNGNYVVLSYQWHNGVAAYVGAATWGNGATGSAGVVTVTNSLVGGQANDQVSMGGVRAMSNGNYVVISPWWGNSAAAQAGAVTWGNGATGSAGVVTVTNSLVGGQANDAVGLNSMIILTNGNYVVLSPWWHNGAATMAGAATWGNGATGITGVVTVANSLVGSQTNDEVGLGAMTLSNNGNYVVLSSNWANGAAAKAGAATWGDGATGSTGVVTVANSLVGTTANDLVGYSGAVLSNGNYVVRSSGWTNGATANAGAVTWCDGAKGTTDVVSVTNSLVGGQANDTVGSGGIVALTNGNYVVLSPAWANGAAASAGAATWGNGVTGSTGVITLANSLVGSQANDNVSSRGAVALPNGNYVVLNPYWHNGAVINAGAVTWGNGATGSTGVISVTNSLVGSHANDYVGNVNSGGVIALTNGNYVVFSPAWANGAVASAGAATWGNGATGSAGVVTVTNSLVGTTASDQVGYSGGTALSNGNYVVRNSYWANGAATQAGAVTLGDGNGGTVGPITGDNSVRGVTANGGSGLNFGYDSTRGQLAVGRLADNIVTLFTINPCMLTVMKAGNGSGSTATTPTGSVFNYGTVVTITATPDTGSSFGGWSSNCAVVGAGCVVTMTASTLVTATFTLDTHTLTVTKAGNGVGTVTSLPDGIACGTSCTANFTASAVVTLTAVPSSTSAFAGWSGAVVTTTNPLALTMDAAKTVTATFITHRVYLPLAIRP